MSRPDPLGDVPAERAAKRLGLSLAAFAEMLPALLQRGFPPADPTTGMFDLEAIDRWRHLRHARLFPELTASRAARDAGSVVAERVEAMARG